MRETWNKGKKMNEDFCKKISKSLIGNKRRWKGMDAGYVAKHMWITKYYGKPKKCENPICSTKNPSRLEWANISGNYKREKEDYVGLCPSCHRRRDLYKLVCKKDHKLYGDNLYVNPKGHRECKKCRRESQRRFKCKE